MPRKNDRKLKIQAYLIEKIMLNEDSIVKRTIDAFNVTKTTVYSNLRELMDKGMIIKCDSGKYKLATNILTYHYDVSEMNETHEDYICKNTIHSLISEYPDNVKRIWQYAFSEMINNVLEHSKSDSLDISIEKNISTTTVKIQDNGIGIFENIMTICGFLTYDEAEEELFKGKLTTDSSNHSGEGLFFTSRIMDKFAAIANGRVFALSNSWDTMINEQELTELLNNKGSTILMCINNNSQKSLRELFDSYINDDGAFNKTTIPMSQLFDGYPVSRSQAKRLSRRFDSFNEVTLDFSNVEEIGQGFADQMFRVFCREYPNTKIVATNCNAAIQKMINHVK